MLPSVGPLELIIVAVIALLIVGPKAVPALARRAGGLAKIGKREAEDFKGVLSMSSERRREDPLEAPSELDPEPDPRRDAEDPQTPT